MPSFTITVDDRRTIKLIRSMKAGLQGRAMKAGWRALLVVYKQHVQKTFRVEGDPKWQELSPATIRRRRKGKGKGQPKILSDTGDLGKSLISKGGRHVERVSVLEAEFGTRVPYGKFHQEGDGVPKREFLTMNDRLKRKLANSLTRGVIRTIRNTNP